MDSGLLQISIIIAIYIISMITIGIISSKKAKTLTDFVVGGRKAGAWVSAFAYGTTYFSAVLFIGYAGRSGWDLGLWAILIGVGNAIIGTYLAWKILAGRTRDVTRRLKIKTMPQMFEQRYSSRNMKIFASVLIFIFMTPYSASVYSGLSYLCETVLGVDYKLAMLVIAIISAVYLVLGGYIASLSADFVQGIIMIFGIIMMVITVVNNDIVGGLTKGMSNLVEKMDQANLTTFSWDIVVSIIGLILLTSLGSWGMPQMIQKFYGVADEKGIKRGTVISTAFAALISIGAYFIGALSRLFFTEVPNNNYDQMIPTILSTTLPPILLGVVLILVLSASVSTLSGITLTSCSTISLDLVAGVLKPNISKKATFTLTRVLCIVFIAVSYIIAITKTPILLLMSFSWGTISGAFLAPYMLGLWWKSMNKLGGWFGMISGLSCSIILAIASGFDAGKAPIFGVIAMIVSFAMSVVGTFIGKKKGGEWASVPDKFFDKTFTLQD